MKITFNRAAFLQKVSSLDEAAQIYWQFIQTHMDLETDRRITNKVEFYGNLENVAEPITNSGNTIFDLQKVWGSRGKTMNSKLLSVFNLFASTKRTPLPNREFTLNDVTFLIPQDSKDSMLISLETLSEYEKDHIQGTMVDGSMLEIKNISKPSHIEETEHRIALGIRIYQKNDKHKPKYTSMGNGESSSPMDLNDKEAQEVLNCAISIGEEKVLYGVKNGKCYAFREHEPGKAIFHGYLVDKPPENVLRAFGMK